MNSVVLYIYIVLILSVIVMFYVLLEKRFNLIRRKVEQTQNLLWKIAKKVGIEEKSDIDQQILALLAEGEKIAAIKKAMEVHPDLGLKEAKKYVETIEKQQKNY